MARPSRFSDPFFVAGKCVDEDASQCLRVLQGLLEEFRETQFGMIMAGHFALHAKDAKDAKGKSGAKATALQTLRE